VANLMYSSRALFSPVSFFSHRKWRHRSRDHSTPGGRLSMGGL